MQAVATLTRAAVNASVVVDIVSPLVTSLCEHAVDAPVRLRAARPDLGIDRGYTPEVPEHLSALSAALLETMYAGPKLLTVRAEVAEGIARLPTAPDAKAAKRKPLPDGALPPEASFAIGDSVRRRDGSDVAVGVVVGAQAAWVASSGLLVVDPPLLVCGRKVLGLSRPVSAKGIVSFFVCTLPFPTPPPPPRPGVWYG